MRAALIAINLITLLGVGSLTLYWPPAAFAFLALGPLALLSLRRIVSTGISARVIFGSTACFASTTLLLLATVWPSALFGFAVVGPLVALGFYDMLQPRRAVLRNFPVIGHARYLMEAIRPELQQYFIESNSDGKPFSREERSLVYQRAKGELDTVPFGTQRDLYQPGQEWINHSLVPKEPVSPPPRVLIGGDVCAQPYRSSLLNISAMSFGALSSNAIAALNLAAARGGFAHNTGEGGLSEHHRKGGDLIWQIGTAYFGCRDEHGRFDAGRFSEAAADPLVRMIEVKLSQGAKPGHGGILPAGKITPEIASIRGVPMGADVVSPPAHREFSTPIELLEFLTRLRELSGGKPVGFKLCLGKRREFLAICKAMLETRMHPDFIVVDGAEGGTGAAPLEFSNSVGCPLTESLIFVDNALRAIDVRKHIALGASGKIVSGFGVAKLIALGADFCYSARSMMMALGCIQARKCNSNDCPVGVATQNPSLTIGLDVEHKAKRVEKYQANTVHAALELVGAAGLAGPEQLAPKHIMRRTSISEIMDYGRLFERLPLGSALGGEIPECLEPAWSRCVSYSFDLVEKEDDGDGGEDLDAPE